MARPPSLRRPAREIMSRELKRIGKKQLAAEARGEEYVLTEADLTAVEAAAKVAALLERLKDDDQDEEKEARPETPEAKAAVLAKLEEKTPARVGRGSPDADDDT